MILEGPGPLGGMQVVRHAQRARRLRLQHPTLRFDRERARALERALRGAELGIERVHVDSRTGRVLIEYRPGARVEEELRATIRSADSKHRRSGARHQEGGGSASPRRRRRRARREAQIQADWHASPLEAVYAQLESRRLGLGEAEVEERRARHGANALEETASRSRLALLADQVMNLPSQILIGSSMISLASRDLLDATGILAAVGIDAAVGYRIERRNEALLRAWAEIEAGEARVLRDGVIRKIPANALVPGDVILVRADELVPADARVIDAHRLSSNEAILTGESAPCSKSVEPVAADAPLAERASMLYSGTTVASGRGRAVVVATGSATEAARIRTLLEVEQPPPTPFEQRFERLSSQLALAGAGAGALTFGLSALRMRPLGDSLRSAVALAVAAIPEGLPMVSTAALVRSMERMRESDMVVRRLVSAETLGGVTVVCADKTGTLTRNEMTLEVADLGQGALDVSKIRAEPEKLLADPATLILAAAFLNSDLDLRRHESGLGVSGTPTEKALLHAAEAAGLDCGALRGLYPRRLLQERAPGRHYVVSRHETPEGGQIAFVKGAPGQVIELCDLDLEGPMDAERKHAHILRNREMADEGRRVLAVAWRPVAEDDEDEGGFTLLGLLGLRDPLREGARETVEMAARAGIRTVILTGDQIPTARAVAREVGLEGEVLRADDLMTLIERDPSQASEHLRHVAAIARVTPSDKAAIVRALRDAGEVVAMAGDGLNDAPAIRAAHVGIAIGRRSSDVSREAADIVLASEDLAAVLMAVGEGRVVQDNLRRAVKYLLATNLSESILAIGSAALGWRDPFTPMRLLWLNLVTDSVPAVALALEPANGDVLARPPAPPDAPMIDDEARETITRDALWITALAGAWLPVGGPPAAFSALVGAQLGYAFACRSVDSEPPEDAFVGMIGATAALHLAAIAFPPFRVLLRLPPLVSATELAAFGVGFTLPYARSHSKRDIVIVRRGGARSEEEIEEEEEQG